MATVGHTPVAITPLWAGDRAALGRRGLEPLTSGATPPIPGGLSCMPTVGRSTVAITPPWAAPRAALGRPGLEQLTTGATRPNPGGLRGGRLGGGGGLQGSAE